jgi:A/G-specific adenine glycosylase
MNNSLGKKAVLDFHRKLHRWYEKNGRKSLPWRNTRDSYAIYVSEVMLQQTQVKTVLERYYFQFLKRFPTLSALAAAPQKEVLKAWEGLGYYNRASNMHETAKRCGGKLPSTVERLVELPGIGQNTAHAVAAFAYTIQVPVVEANVKRVLSRLGAKKTPLDTELWSFAHRLLDRKNPFDYNQAMMDLGSLVCTKRTPKCTLCPANGICLGQKSPESYPTKKSKKSIPMRKKHIVVLQNPAEKYFAEPRKGRFLNGLYHFTEQVEKPKNAAHLGSVRQQYSHFTLEAEIYGSHAKKSGKNWHSLAELKRLPFSAAEQKILRLLEKKTVGIGQKSIIVKNV